MSTGTAWNGPTITNIWTSPYPYSTDYSYTNTSCGKLVTAQGGWNIDPLNWFNLALESGGAWTWNVPRALNDPQSYFLFHPNHVALIQNVFLASDLVG